MPTTQARWDALAENLTLQKVSGNEILYPDFTSCSWLYENDCFLVYVCVLHFVPFLIFILVLCLISFFVFSPSTWFLGDYHSRQTVSKFAFLMRAGVDETEKRREMFAVLDENASLR